MEYFIIDDDLINDLNRGMMRSLRPDSIRNPDDVTDLYASIVTHPVNGDTALVMDDGNHTVHLQAQSMPLAGVYNQMRVRGTIDMAERDAMMDFLTDNKGEVVVMKDFIPPSIPANTYEDLEAAGWFPAQGE